MTEKNKEVKEKLRDSIECTEGVKLFYEYICGMGGGFYRNLFDAMMVADSINISRLRSGFPEEVGAVIRYNNEPDYWEKVQKAYKSWIDSNR